MQKDSQYRIKHLYLTNRLRNFGESVDKCILAENTRTFMHELLTTYEENVEYLKYLCQKIFEESQNYTIAQLTYFKVISNLVRDIETIRKTYPELVEKINKDKKEVLNKTAEQYGVGFLSLKPNTTFANSNSTVTVTINSYNAEADVINVTCNKSVEDWKPEKLAEFLITNQMNEVLNED